MEFYKYKTTESITNVFQCIACIGGLVYVAVIYSMSVLCVWGCLIYSVSVLCV